MSYDYDKLIAPGTQGSDTRPPKKIESFRPGIEFNSAGQGMLRTDWISPEQEFSVRDEFLKYNVDISGYDIIPQGFKQYGRPEDPMKSYAFKFQEKNPYELAQADTDALKKKIESWKPTRSAQVGSGDNAYVHVSADKQIGKRLGNAGTSQTVDRIFAGIDKSVNRYKQLSKMVGGFGTIVLPELGDHVEGNTSQNGKLQGLAASDLGQTQQVMVAWRTRLKEIMAFAPLAERIIVPVVNGNHDEVTRQVAADPVDGWNVAINAIVQDIISTNPALVDKIEFRFPDYGHQTLTVDVNGILLGCFHGHQMRDPLKYISAQSAGQTELGGADLFLSGHFHNFKVTSIGERTHLQAPTIDPGSAWFRDRAGMESKPGFLTFALGTNIDPTEWLGVIPV